MGDAEATGRSVRHQLEADGDQCLLVFDNTANPADLLPFIPAAGKAKILITSNELPAANLGTGVAVDVFTEAEALAFLADRTGSADTDGARLIAQELGRLPLALAQAAAVIVAQRLDYPAYLQRLRSMRVDQLLLRIGTDHYPHGLAAAVLLSLEAVRARDESGMCTSVMDLVSVLSPTGVPRDLAYAAAQARTLSTGNGALPRRASPAMVDGALGLLAGSSLLTFSVDGKTVTTHRLVMRVIRERLARQGYLHATCLAAAATLHIWGTSLRKAWQDRPSRRDLVEQVMAVHGHAVPGSGKAGSELTGAIMMLRGQAIWFLHELGDSAAQAILIAKPLLADQEQLLGPEHPETLTTMSNLALAYQKTGQIENAIRLYERTLADSERILTSDHPDIMMTRSNLAIAYRDTGRVEEAITLHERTLADRERILGLDHPDTQASRNNLATAKASKDVLPPRRHGKTTRP